MVEMATTGPREGFIISLGFLQMYLLYKCGYNFKCCKRWHVLYLVMDLNVWGIYIMSVYKHHWSGILDIIAHHLLPSGFISFLTIMVAGPSRLGCLAACTTGACREAVRPRGGARRPRGCGGGTCFYALQLALPRQCAPQPAPASVCVCVCACGPMHIEAARSPS